MVDDLFNDVFDVFVLHDFFVVSVHLLEEINATHIVLEVRLSQRQQEL